MQMESFVTGNERWEAVMRRDSRADGAFYYSVRTTGVYCRPSCSARQPRRENVRFHDSCAQAQQAGFRPCKRCKPNEPSLTERQAAVVVAACRMIEAAEAMPRLADLAEATGMSRYHFHRIFKAHTGVTPKGYADALRIQRVQEEMQTSPTVIEAIYNAGFNSAGRFYERSTEWLGMTPTNFRKGGCGTAIRFAVGECSLGMILVAATDRGICSIMLGDDPEKLVQDLQDRFSKSTLVAGDHDFDLLVAKVIEFVEAPTLGLDLPLDVRGTAFQQRVWQALRSIPPGSTATYTEIARLIGHPNAARAVAQACAANQIAVAIPCHRVVRTDGDRSGYRWGVWRKKKLLEQERVETASTERALDELKDPGL